MKYWKEIVVGSALLGLFFLFVFTKVNTSNSTLQNTYDPIEKVNDSLREQNVEIDTHIEKFEKEVDSLNQDIKEDDKVLTALKETKDEKVLHIHNASNVELMEFFASFKTKDSID